MTINLSPTQVVAALGVLLDDRFQGVEAVWRVVIS